MSELKEIGIRWEENGELHFSHVYLKSEADKVIAHQKYKRCIKMAKWCHDKWIMSLGWDPTDGHTADFYLHYEKWEKRWLELAEKFKEVK